MGHYTQSKDVDDNGNLHIYANDGDCYLQDIVAKEVILYLDENNIFLENVNAKVITINGDRNILHIDENSNIEILNDQTEDMKLNIHSKPKLYITAIKKDHTIGETYYNFEENKYYNITPLFFNGYHIYPNLEYTLNFSKQFNHIKDVPLLTENILSALVGI